MDQIEDLRLGPLGTINAVINAPEGFIAFVNSRGPSGELHSPTQQWYFTAEPLRALSRVESSASFQTAEEAFDVLKTILRVESVGDGMSNSIPDLADGAFIVYGEVVDGPKLEVWRAGAESALTVALNKGMRGLLISPTDDGAKGTLTLHYTSREGLRMSLTPLPGESVALNDALSNWARNL